MAKKDTTTTPRSRVRQALRLLFLRSREAATCRKNARNTCEVCGAKGSTAKGREVKTCVHHKDGIDKWEEVIDMILEHIICRPEKLQLLCKKCHNDLHAKEREEKKLAKFDDLARKIIKFLSKSVEIEKS